MFVQSCSTNQFSQTQNIEIDITRMLTSPFHGADLVYKHGFYKAMSVQLLHIFDRRNYMPSLSPVHRECANALIQKNIGTKTVAWRFGCHHTTFLRPIDRFHEGNTRDTYEERPGRRSVTTPRPKHHIIHQHVMLPATRYDATMMYHISSSVLTFSSGLGTRRSHVEQIILFSSFMNPDSTWKTLPEFKVWRWARGSVVWGGISYNHRTDKLMCRLEAGLMPFTTGTICWDEYSA